MWDELNPADPPCVRWLRPVEGSRVVLLLGAFDPPTNAHVSIARTASRVLGVPAALCMTKVTLDRPPDELLPPPERLRLLDAIAVEEGFGLCISNRGTYLDVATALVGDGFEPSFVIGSDKLPQLAEPSFYDDGEHGVARTFNELSFVVVRRAGTDVDRDDVRVLETNDVFADASDALISGTEVRRRVRSGELFEHLVPPGVGLALRGYTSAR